MGQGEGVAEAVDARLILQLRSGSATDLAEGTGDELPRVIRLHAAYPNPFNPATTIRYELPESAAVRLDVFNLMGQRVATLQNGTQPAGVHSVRFDAGALSSGVYLYRLQAGSFSDVKKMTVLK